MRNPRVRQGGKSRTSSRPRPEPSPTKGARPSRTENTPPSRERPGYFDGSPGFSPKPHHQCSAQSFRKRPSPLPEEGAIRGEWGRGQGRQLSANLRAEQIYKQYQAGRRNEGRATSAEQSCLFFGNWHRNSNAICQWVNSCTTHVRIDTQMYLVSLHL